MAVLNLNHLNVLLVADVSAETIHGGAERMLHQHIRALHDAGAHVSVLTRQPEADSDTLIKLHNGVVEHRLQFNGDKGWKGLLQLRKKAKIWWQTHQNFDVIIAEQPFVMWALMQAGCKLPRLQVCHSFAFEEYSTRHGLDWGIKHRFIAAAMRRLEARVYQQAQAHLVLSSFMKNRLQQFFSIKPQTITIAAAGVHEVARAWSERQNMRQSLYSDNASLPVIVTLRNLVPRTGVDLLIQAAAIVHIDRPDVRWKIIGNGSLLEPLKQLSKQLHVHHIIEFCNFLPEKEMQQQLWAADLFMLPTRSLEGFGLVTLEANALGLPVIATPVGANPDVVSWHADNRVASQATPAALAQATLDYLDHLPNIEQRQDLAGDTMKHFAWQKHDAILLNMVRGLS